MKDGAGHIWLIGLPRAGAGVAEAMMPKLSIYRLPVPRHILIDNIAGWQDGFECR